MSLTQAFALLGLVAMVIVFVFSVIWVWRDMAERSRPRWLRLTVLLAGNVLVLGFVIYLVDLRRHPHDPNLTRWDVALQRYRRRPSLERVQLPQ